ITQPYRIPGTPNYPDEKKRGRGRTVVATKLIHVSDRLWTPEEITAAFPVIDKPKRRASGATIAPVPVNRGRRAMARVKIATKASAKMDRSNHFHSCISSAVRAGMTADEIEAEMRNNPDGCAQKYLENGDRLQAEIQRSVE